MYILIFDAVESWLHNASKIILSSVGHPPHPGAHLVVSCLGYAMRIYPQSILLLHLLACMFRVYICFS